MGRRLLLDTTELIAFERDGTIRGIGDGDTLALASISLGELYRGIVSTPIERTRKRRLDFFEYISSGDDIEVLLYTPQTARVHGFLLDYTKRVGYPRGAHDLIIAAHARETGREIFSTDGKAKFGDLPGVSVAELYV